MRLAVAIPSSFTSNFDSLIQRTYAAASIARFCSIYRVEYIYLYRDPLDPDLESSRQVTKILRYLATPPYLRKVLFPIDRDLSYVGIAPPINLDVYKEWRPIKDLELPDVRLGTQVKYSREGTVLDVGLDKPALVEGKLIMGRIYAVRLEKVTGKYIRGVLATDVYTGYKVVRVKERLPVFLDKFRGLKIGTSKYGVLYHEVRDRLARDLDRSEDVLIVFGSHGYGLREILGHYGVSPEEVFDYFVNLVTDQGTDTIRVEEAVAIALSTIRALSELI